MIKLNIIKINKIVLSLSCIGGSLVMFALIISIWLGFIASFRVVFGSFYVLFLPGLMLTYAVFGPRRIDIIERITLSFALSISIVPLMVFYLNKIGIKINFLNTCLEVLALIVLSLLFFLRSYKKQGCG